MQESLSERLREQALSPVECDVPERWSLAEYRVAVGLLSDLERPWWRRWLALREQHGRRTE